MSFEFAQIKSVFYAATDWYDVQEELAYLDTYITNYLESHNDQFPEDVLDLFIEILSKEELYGKKGLLSF